ncbi:MAG: hypothetical protein D6746_15545 [Bacteroidetes bacterium]|nr:MAG: hypothetical protein D6746_15545 [Bacteroidota bacterium]GIV58550.1 MAG: hypothetical protein KatS3mg042_1463 [Rhodothermaceae bacterium]
MKNENTLPNHSHPVLDWLLDHVALLTLALAAVAVMSVLLGSGMVVWGRFTWAEASEVAIYTGLTFGALIFLYRVFCCVREACHRKTWQDEG